MSKFSIDDYLTEIDLEGIIINSDKIEDIKTNFFSKIIECINVFNKEITFKLNEIKSDPVKFEKFCKSFKSNNNMLNLLGNHQEGSDGLIKYLTEYLNKPEVNAIMEEKYYKNQGSKEQFINKVKDYAQEMYNDNYKKLISQINKECTSIASPGGEPQPEPKPKPDGKPDGEPQPDGEHQPGPAPQPLVTPSPSQKGKITAKVTQEDEEINEQDGYYTVNPIEQTIIELESSKEEDFSPTYKINGSGNEININDKKIILNTSELISSFLTENKIVTINISADNHEPLEIKMKTKQSDPESFSIEVKEGEAVIKPDSDGKYQLENNNNVKIVVSGLDTQMNFVYKIHKGEEKSISGESIESTQNIDITKEEITEIQVEQFNVEIKQHTSIGGGGEKTKNKKTITIIKKQTDEHTPDPSEKIELGAPPDTQYDQIGVADRQEGINSTDKIFQSEKILALLQVHGEKDFETFTDYYFVHSDKIIKNKDKSEQIIQIMDNSVKLINGKYCIKFYINNIKKISELNKGDKISVISIFFNKKLDIIQNILSEINNDNYENKIYLIKDNNNDIENGVILEILEFQHNDNYSKFVNLNGVPLTIIK